MANGNDNNSKGRVRDGNNTNLLPLMVAILGAFGGGIGGNYIWLRANPDAIQEVARPDPFTGSDAQRLERSLDNLQEDLINLRRDVDKLPPRQLTERVRILEIQIQAIQIQLDKCCKPN